MRASRRQKTRLSLVGANEAHSTNRWVVSYADFVTLLFALFLVLFASAQMNKQQFADVITNIQHSLAMNPPIEGADLTSNEGAATYPTGVLPFSSRQFDTLYFSGVDVLADTQWIELHLPADVFFVSGSADISEDAQRALNAIFESLGQVQGDIFIEGHTDSHPIYSDTYSSNWSLSAARAVAVTERLINAGLPADQFRVEGYADTAPLTKEISKADAAMNRRVEIRFSASSLTPNTNHNAPSGANLDIAPLTGAIVEETPEVEGAIKPQAYLLKNGGLLFSKHPERHQKRLSPTADVNSESDMLVPHE